MQAKCMCPQHGKLEFDDIIIKNGNPTCRKCMSVLEFGKIQPRRVMKGKKK